MKCACTPPARSCRDSSRNCGRKNWKINFESGSERFTPDATKVLEELYDQTVVTRTIVEINGHTDRASELAKEYRLVVESILERRGMINFLATALALDFPATKIAGGRRE